MKGAEPWTDAQNYCHMLSNLMGTIQDFLVLSDTAEERGAEKSLALLDRTAASSRSFGPSQRLQLFV